MTQLTQRVGELLLAVPGASFTADEVTLGEASICATDIGQFIDAVHALAALSAPPRSTGLGPSRSLPVAQLEELALTNPAELIRLVRARLASDPVVVAQTAEALALADGSEPVIQFLLELTQHQRPFVREAAIYGLAPSLETSERARRVIEALRVDDPSPGVREAAADVLLLLH